MNGTQLALFLAGWVLLAAGANAFVRGASRLAFALGMPPVVVGLTIAAWATGSPELAVSLQASLAGEGAITMGNVVGSNIFNILVVLGLSALITPLVVAQRVVRLDVPIMIGATFLLLVLVLDGSLGRLDGLVLLAAFAAHSGFTFRSARRTARAVAAQYREALGPRPTTPATIGVQVGLIVAGLAGLVLGSRWLVDGASAMARSLGLSELVIGLTIVAIGTSLPEVATSVVASWRGDEDIAVGNAIGSNLFNVLAVLGLAGLITPGGVPVPPEALRFDLPVMAATAVACLPIFVEGHILRRWEGALFVGYYVAYLAYVVLAATRHHTLPMFSNVMLFFVIPLTAITLGVVWARAWRSHRR